MMARFLYEEDTLMVKDEEKEFCQRKRMVPFSAESYKELQFVIVMPNFLISKNLKCSGEL